MRKRDGLVWTTAAASSLLVHALLFLNSGSLAGVQEQQPQELRVTRVTFRSVTSPSTLPKAVPLKVPPEVVEPEVTEAPEPPSEPTPSQPEKRAERAREVEPQSSPEFPEPVPTVPTSAAADKLPAVTEAVQGTVEDPALIEKAKQEYLRRLMAHIEKYKHYPRAARRRRIEGDVRVTFKLQQNGRVGNLIVDGTQKVLNSATQRAVEEALPLPEPPPSLSLPWPVAFTMRFRLE